MSAFGIQETGPWMVVLSRAGGYEGFEIVPGCILLGRSPPVAGSECIDFLPSRGHRAMDDDALLSLVGAPRVAAFFMDIDRVCACRCERGLGEPRAELVSLFLVRG